MNAIIGLVVTMVMVFGGYILAGGKMSIILKSLPFEMMMIGGAATGAFVAANDMATIKHTAGDLGAAFEEWLQRELSHSAQAVKGIDGHAGSPAMVRAISSTDFCSVMRSSDAIGKAANALIRS